MIGVERCRPFVVDDAPRLEVWLAGRLAVLEAFNAMRYGFDSATDTFLDEVCREVCLVFQISV
jgi:hypothetical protein